MGPGKPPKKVEGEFHYLYYRGPDSTKSDQLTRNFITALKVAGYTLAYTAPGNNDVVFIWARPGFANKSAALCTSRPS
jgi:hypothetical protein